MSKRSWHDANLSSPRSMTGPAGQSSVSPGNTFTSPTGSSSPHKFRSIAEEPASKQSKLNNNHNGSHNESTKMPGISRKVKACAACRKQKVSQFKTVAVLAGLTDIMLDQMYHDGRSTLPTMQRTRLVL